MKILYQVGTSTPQVLIVRSQGRNFRNQHDPWRDHAIYIDPTGGATYGNSGNIYYGIQAILKDGNLYEYFTPSFGNDYAVYNNWYKAASEVYLPSGSGPWFGEGFNYYIRSQLTEKILSSDFAQWFLYH